MGRVSRWRKIEAASLCNFDRRCRRNQSVAKEPEGSVMSRRLTDEDREMFAEFSSDYRLCWACGIPDGQRDTLIDHPRNLERAHIIGGAGRVHDRRNLARLCAMCHRLHHGDTIRRPNGKPLPNLRFDHLLWLQYRFEGYIDRKFLRSIRISQFIPRPCIVPAWHLAQFRKWQGCEHSQWR